MAEVAYSPVLVRDQAESLSPRGGLSIGQNFQVIGYLRVSSDEQARSGLGLEAQRRAILDEITVRGWTLHSWAVDEGFSAKRKAPPRPAYLNARGLLRTKQADGLIASKLDRVHRSTVDFGGLLEAALREKWALVLMDLPADTTTASGRAMLRQMAVWAEFERDLISERTIAALAVLKSQGVRLGAPRQIPAETEALIVHYSRSLSLAAIADRLNGEGVKTVGGKPWAKSTVASVVRRSR